MATNPYAQICDVTVSYTQPDCAPIASGVRQLSLIHKDVIANIKASPSNGTLWTQEIVNGNIIAPIDVRGEKPKGTANQLPGFRDKKLRTIGRDFTMTLQMQFDTDNYAFFNDINQSNVYYAAYTSGDADNRVMFISSDLVDFDSDDVIAPDLNGELVYDITLNWDNININQTYDMPPGIFA